MRIQTILAIGILPVAIIFSAAYFNLVRKNNIEAPSPSKQEIQLALNKSIEWVLTNQNELVKINNPALWWFLDESAILNSNSDLANLVSKYRNTILEKNSLWNGYWRNVKSFIYIPGSLDHMEKYQKFFAYALTCNTELGDEQEIQNQFDSSFCGWSPYYSSCTTHQLMSIRLLQINGCGNQQKNQILSDELSNKIYEQMIWDPRVGDVYIQRVLMLVESGNRAKVKPIWIKHILAEQRDGGGWASFYRLFNITDNTEFGYGYKFPEVRSSVDVNFHSTAQAIYLLSLLAKN